MLFRVHLDLPYLFPPSPHRPHAQPVQPERPQCGKLLAEVLIEEPVDDRVGARRGHAQHVADGVHVDEDLLAEGGEQVGRVGHGVEQVERQPAQAEDEADPDQELDGALKADDVALPSLFVAP